MKKGFLKAQKFIPVVTMLIFIFSLSTAQLARAAQNNTIQTLPSFADLADKVKDSVVNIATTQKTVLYCYRSSGLFHPGGPDDDLRDDN